jgi:hypothetical protein
MKRILTTYSISGSVVTLTGVNVPLNQILLIANATTGAVLYSVGGPAPTSYNQTTNSTITLATAPGATDKLSIFYEDAVTTLATSNTPSVAFTYSSSGAVSSGTFALASTDISAFSSVVIAAHSIGVGGVIAFEFSNDNTNWVAGIMSRVDIVSGGFNQASAIFAGAGSGAAYASPTWGFKWFRARVSTQYTSGTNNITFSFSNNPVPLQTHTVSLATAPQVYPTITVGVQGFFNFHTLISSASTNVTNIATGQKNIGSLWLTNTTASLKFFKVFNATSATIGTSTPVLNLPIPPNTTTDFSTSFCSMRFGTGFTYAITGGSALLDSTSVAAGDVIVNLTHF